MKATPETIKKEAEELLTETEFFNYHSNATQHRYFDRIKDLLRELTTIDLKPQEIKSTPFEKEIDILVVQMPHSSSLEHTQAVYDGLTAAGIKNVTIIEKVDNPGFFILSEKGKEKI